MSRFNRNTAPVTPTPDTFTGQGGEGFTRSDKHALFVLGTSNFVGGDTFFEDADSRDTRFVDLVHRCTTADPDWTAAFIGWLRQGAFMRTASIIAAAEYVKAGGPNGRRVVASVLQRADEPAEMIGYWWATHGRNIPKPVKRGVADAVRRLYTERNVIRYDGTNDAIRFGDVVNVVHPVPAGPWQQDLFRYVLDRRHNRVDVNTERLPALAADRSLMGTPPAERRARLGDAIAAGWNWERIAGWLPDGMDADAWTACIPGMGVMACLAADTPVWMPDGTTATIEDVVKRRLPVLAYDKAADTRPTRYGPSQTRDNTLGTLTPTMPVDWLDVGEKPLTQITFASGRTLTATSDHRWLTGRRGQGRSAWEWRTTADLIVGDKVPVPLTAQFFGDEGDSIDGYFIGAMLGDGGMTGTTPEFHCQPGDAAHEFMADYVTKFGCNLTVIEQPGCIRLRFIDPRPGVNAITDILRSHGVWGQRVETKHFANRPYSAEFWRGAIAGLIDTDGCIRVRQNNKGVRHATIEFAVTSSRLAEQCSDALLRLGVYSTLRRLPVRVNTGFGGNFDMWKVEVSSAEALRRFADQIPVRVKADKLDAVRDIVESQPGKKGSGDPLRGYDRDVVMDRVIGIEDAGTGNAYCVTVNPSNAFVANGVLTGNCTRNLRNFDKVGLDGDAYQQVAAKLADPEAVAASRMFPFRFFTAWKNLQASMRWGQPLETALGHSLANIPRFDGRTLVLVDVSGSMMIDRIASMRTDSRADTANTVARWEGAALFAAAIARTSGAKIVLFNSAPKAVMTVNPGESIIRSVESMRSWVGGGTDTLGSLAAAYNGEDRVVIVTDEQTGSYYSGGWNPAGWDRVRHIRVPVFTFNCGGYQTGHTPDGFANWYTFAGLSDASFKAIAAVEQANRRVDVWPWEVPSAEDDTDAAREMVEV